MSLSPKFSLREIANWQLSKQECLIELPTLQRGFVWKTKQIEDLWDSLLRGFPIGSFLLSKTKEGKYHLMDGQQRATSIFLGFFNPYTDSSNTNTWSIKGELPVVWIDICPESKPDNNLYSIRLTTRSHPWGYQARFNDKVLTVKDRRDALSIFKENPNNQNIGYTHFKQTTTFPYDAAYPIPLSFFIEAQSVQDVIDKCESYLPLYFKTKPGKFNDKNEFLEHIKNEQKTHLRNIFNKIKNLEDIKINYDELSNDVLFERDDANSGDNPTLFIRINSSGTELNGDDLIYSIYKAIFPETKELVEKIAVNFIKPTQIISLASRIAQSTLNNHAFPHKIGVRDFQQKIRDDDFKNELQSLIKGGKLEEKIDIAIDILLNKDEIPPVIVKQFITNSQELFLLLLYWLIRNEDSPQLQLHRTIAGKLLTISWFGYDNKKFIKEMLWEKTGDVHFWEQPLREYLGSRLYFLLPPQLLMEYYDQEAVKENFFLNIDRRWEFYDEGTGEKVMDYYKAVSNNNELESAAANTYFRPFVIDVLRWKRPLVLLAQREYINKEFKDYNQIENLEDTNAPWDWDHIYPTNWVYNKQHCERVIKDWQYTIGNVRTISLEQNRSESDHLSPKERLSDPKDRVCSFIKEDDWAYWEQIEYRIYETDKVMLHFNAIVKRMLNIYKEYWGYFDMDNILGK